MDEKEAAELLASYGLKEPGLNRLIRATYDLLGLIQFFTAGEPEVRAWTIRKGATAVMAAGAIHSDIEKGFFFSSRRRHTSSVSAFLLNRSSDLGRQHTYHHYRTQRPAYEKTESLPRA